MDTKLKIGDRIVYKGVEGYFDTDKVQIITGKTFTMDGDYIHSMFIDTGDKNMFHINSDYFKKCNITYGEEIFEYKNGIPVMWEDEL